MADKAERRELKFQNLTEVVQEVERLASGHVRTTGRHSFGQILNHLMLSNRMLQSAAANRLLLRF